MKRDLSHQQQLGKRGEDYASSYLTSHGYRILERNYRIHYGELDIIAVDQMTVVYVEVKTRTDLAYGLPEEAITARKLKELIKTATYYRMVHPHLPEKERIDVIALVMDHNDNVHYFKHIKNATG